MGRSGQKKANYWIQSAPELGVLCLGWGLRRVLLVNLSGYPTYPSSKGSYWLDSSSWVDCDSYCSAVNGILIEWSISLNTTFLGLADRKTTLPCSSGVYLYIEIGIWMPFFNLKGGFRSKITKIRMPILFVDYDAERSNALELRTF